MTADERDELARARLLDCVRRHPGESGTIICSRARIQRGLVFRLLGELTTEGKIRKRSGVGNAKVYTIPPQSQPPLTGAQWESSSAGDGTRLIGCAPLEPMDAAITAERAAGRHTLADRLTTLRDAWARAVERTAAVEDAEPPERLQAGG